MMMMMLLADDNAELETKQANWASSAEHGKEDVFFQEEVERKC